MFVSRAAAAGLVLMAAAACTAGTPEPKMDTTVGFPNVIGMSGQEARRSIEAIFSRAYAMPEGREPEHYGFSSPCLWKDTSGKLSLIESWPVSGVARYLNPNMPTEPSAPVQPGSRFEPTARLLLRLDTEKPADVSCVPVGGSPGPAGKAPDIDLPNHSDDGEPWICRRHRWC